MTRNDLLSKQRRAGKIDLNPREGWWWRGDECVNGHWVFGKSKPLGAAWFLPSTRLQCVPKMGGSGTSRSNPGEGWMGRGAAAQPPGDHQQQQQLNVDQTLA